MFKKLTRREKILSECFTSKEREPHTHRHRARDNEREEGRE